MTDESWRYQQDKAITIFFWKWKGFRDYRCKLLFEEMKKLFKTELYAKSQTVGKRLNNA